MLGDGLPGLSSVLINQHSSMTLSLSGKSVATAWLEYIMAASAYQYISGSPLAAIGKPPCVKEGPPVGLDGGALGDESHLMASGLAMAPPRLPYFDTGMSLSVLSGCWWHSHGRLVQTSCAK